MAFVYADRVKEESTSVGFAAMVLAGAVNGFQTFEDGIGDGNETYYTIFNGGDNSWEVGIGTYTSAGTSLSRDTVLASSNGGASVAFPAGTKTVFASVAAQFFDSALDAVGHSSLNHTGIPGVPAPETFTAADHSLVDHTAIPFSLLDLIGHSAINHKNPPFNLLDEPAHDALDHTGVPGVNSFDSVQHSLTNHAGILGVPAPEAFTAGVHAGTDHSGITGVDNYKVRQVVYNELLTPQSHAGTIPLDNTIPQIGEGGSVITASITPESLSNFLLIEFNSWIAIGTNERCAVALFQQPTANAIAAISVGHDGTFWTPNSGGPTVVLRKRIPVPSLALLTFEIRVGSTVNITRVNADFIGTPLYGGVSTTTLTITELAP